MSWGSQNQDFIGIALSVRERTDRQTERGIWGMHHTAMDNTANSTQKLLLAVAACSTW